MNKQTVLITGASRGIGAAIARLSAKKGYHTVITCSESKSELLTIKKELETAYGSFCTAKVCDAGDFEAMQKLFTEIPAPDILINNAGIAYFGLLSEMSVTDWQHVMNTNLNSCFYSCKLAIPSMVQKKAGRILNISSVWGHAGSSMETAYCASKGGVNAFTKALAKELAPSNIQVNALSPGLIDTKMNHNLSAEELEELRQEIPADRLGTPEEAAEMAWQILESPAYLTGQIITLDGGWI